LANALAWNVLAPRQSSGAASSPAAAGLLGSFREAWRRPLAAGLDNVNVWCLPRGHDRTLAHQAGVLGCDEWSALARVRDLSSRDQLRDTRIVLRHALSHAVAGAVPPQAWRFRSTSYGKPQIAPGLPQVHFSMSHTGTLSVIAVSPHGPVGVDAETVGVAPDDRIVASFCSNSERRSLLRLAKSERPRAFARLWTLKEAYSKLTGTGLATNFKSISFQVEPDQHVASNGTKHRSGAPSLTSWLTETPAGLCQLSLAVDVSRPEGKGGEIVCFAASPAHANHPAAQLPA
jgi:4'-phosphopantetheinyl transferase